MNRSYNFQVDNGLFVAAHYLKKDYEDITIDDLRDNVDKFAQLLYDCNNLLVTNAKKQKVRLSTSSHNNSALAQAAYEKNRLERIAEQLNDCVDMIADHKTCCVCGEKLVNVGIDPNSSLMYGIPSMTTFSNRSNNLNNIDVCGKCLFLSLLSFLNTQKISYPFLYMSDSDEFMEDITKGIQKDLKKKELLDLRLDNSGQYFLEFVEEALFADEEYSDMTYIELVYFSNAQNNYYESGRIDKDKIMFLLKLKDHGLIKEFAEVKLFQAFFKDTLSAGSMLIDDKKYMKDKKQTYELKCTKELYKRIEGYIMTNKEIEMVEYATGVLLENYSVDDLLKDLKTVGSRQAFKNFIKEHSEVKTIYRSLSEFNELSNVYKYKDALVANLLLHK